MHTIHQRLFILRIYTILSFAGSLACFIALYRLSPGDGSQARFWISALPAVFAVLFLCLAILAFRRTNTEKLLVLSEKFHGGGVWYTTAFLVLFYIFIISQIYSLSASPKLYGPVYPIWLMPVFLWLVWISGLALVHLVILRFGPSPTVVIGLLAVISFLVMGIAVSLQFWGFESPRGGYLLYLPGWRAFVTG